MALTAHELAIKAGQLALEKRASNVKILDMRGLTAVTDFFVICSGAAGIQVKAIAENIREKLADQGQRPWHVEGYEYGRWILLDYIDFVVHVFHHDLRGFYDLERLWGDAPQESVED